MDLRSEWGNHMVLFGQSGFDELRKHVKIGNEWCREVGAILQERAEVEASFAKNLSRLAAKLTKATNVCCGTLVAAWALAATEMESQAEMHKVFAASLSDQIAKPIKLLADQQHKTRKPIEATVDRAYKSLQEKRAEETKLKKLAFSTAKDREKSCDNVLYSRSSKGKSLTEKELSKMEKKVKALDDSMLKSDGDYLDMCKRTESCRQDWETYIYKGSSQLQSLEEERISKMQSFLSQFNQNLSQLPPKLTQSCAKLGEAVLSVSSTDDLQAIIHQKGTSPAAPEQILPDFYAEEKVNVMDKDRRKDALTGYITSVEHALETETKGRDGVQKLMDVYISKPGYGDLEAQADTQQKLNSVNSTISYLEAIHYKLACALAELEGQPQPQSSYSNCIERHKDKQGIFTSVLRVPLEMTQSRRPGDGEHADTAYENMELGARPRSLLMSQTSIGSNGTYGRSKRKSMSAPSPPAQTSVREPIPSYPESTAAVEADPMSYEPDNLTAIEKLARGPTNGAASNGSVRSRPTSTISSGSLRKAPRPPLPQSMSPVSPASPTPPARPANQPGNRETFYPFDAGEFDDYAQAHAIYSYTGQQHDELTIEEGDVVTVIEQQEDGWSRVELNGQTGLVPSTYIEMSSSP